MKNKGVGEIHLSYKAIQPFKLRNGILELSMVIIILLHVMIIMRRTRECMVN